MREWGLSSYLEDYDGAIADFTEAIRLQPNVETYLYRGDIRYEYKGDYEGAIADYSICIDWSPAGAEAYVGRGLAHFEHEAYEAAISDFTNAAELLDDGYWYYMRGSAYAALGDYQQAVEDCTLAIKVVKHSGSAYYHRAFYRAKLGDFRGAIEDAQNYVTDYPNSRAAAVLRQSIEAWGAGRYE